jgi:hypothetical protein
MRKFIIGGIAAIVLALGFTAGNASAYWTTRSVYNWDPVSGTYFPVVQRVWVADPVVYYPSYYPGYYPRYYGYGPWYDSGYYRHHHHHHDHHEHFEHEHHHHH